jgi:serine protease
LACIVHSVFAVKWRFLWPLVTTVACSAGADLGESESSIIGGKEVESDGEFPWAVVLIGKNGRQTCTGTLVADHWVLTAAHCVDGDGIATAGIGSRSVKTVLADPRLQFPVTKGIAHPRHDPKTDVPDFDVGLMRIGRDAAGAPHATFIHSKAQEEKAIDAKSFTVIGWGQDESKKKSDILRRVTVPFVAFDRCMQRLGETEETMNAETMMCSGRRGRDTCDGDSGAPLFIEGDVPLLVGTTSWGGPKCAQAPGVYARLATLGAWVKRCVDADGDAAACGKP